MLIKRHQEEAYFCHQMPHSYYIAYRFSLLFNRKDLRRKNKLQALGNIYCMIDLVFQIAAFIYLGFFFYKIQVNYEAIWNNLLILN